MRVTALRTIAADFASRSDAAGCPDPMDSLGMSTSEGASGSCFGCCSFQRNGNRPKSAPFSHRGPSRWSNIPSGKPGAPGNSDCALNL